MAKVIEVLGFENKGEYGLVTVLTDEGDECTVWVGGQVEVYFDKGKIKAFVKRPTSGKVVD